MIDQFSSTLGRAQQALNRTVSAAERLRQTFQQRIAVEVDASVAMSRIDQVQSRLQSIGRVEVMAQVTIPDAASVRSRLSAVLSGVRPVAIPVAVDGEAAVQEALSLRQRIGDLFSSITVGIRAPDLSHIRTQLSAAFEHIGTIGLHIDAADIAVIKQRVESELGTIRAQIQVVLPASLHVMFANLQRLVMRLLTATRRLGSMSDNTSQLEAALQRIAALEQRINDLQGQLNGNVGRMGGRFKGVLDYLKGIGKQYLLLAGAQIGLSVVGSLDQQKLKDTFIARTGDVTVGSSMSEKFKQEALATGQDVTEALQGALSFFPVTQNTDQLSQLNSMAAQLAAFDLSGGGIKEAASALKAAMGGDTGSLAESFSMPEPAMKELNIDRLGQSGNIDGFIQAFNQLLEKQRMGEQAFQTMMATPANQLKTLGNNTKATMADAGNAIVQALLPLIAMLNRMFQQGEAQAFFHALGTAIGWVTSLMADLVRGALWLGEVVANNWDIFSSVLGGIASLIGMLLIPRLWAMIPPLGAMIASLWASIAPLSVIIAEWLLMNWPIILVAALVGTFMYVLQQCGVTASDVIGFIVGLFTTLGGIIYNTVATLWNYFASFAEFLINLFIDPTYAVQKLIYDLAMTFGGYMLNMLRSAEDFAGGFMETILDAINGILKGFNWLSKKIADLTGVKLGTVDLFDTENASALSDRLQGMLDKLEKPESSQSVVTIGRMQQKNLKNEFDYGFKKGSSFANSFQFKGASVDESALNKWNSSQQPMAANVDNINRVGEVGKINDKVDISSEDLKMMRELAEMKNIQNFVTLQPQLSFGDTHVRQEGRSVDEIVANIKVRLQEELVSSAQGVYG